jgi:hypothetical protein
MGNVQSCEIGGCCEGRSEGWILAKKPAVLASNPSSFTSQKPGGYVQRQEQRVIFGHSSAEATPPNRRTSEVLTPAEGSSPNRRSSESSPEEAFVELEQKVGL